MKTCFPARKANGGDYASLNEVMDRIEREPHGSWLAGTNQMWHGGIHLTEVTAPGAVLSESRADKTVPLQSMADGEIVAWRVNRDYLTADYCGQCLQYSSTFLLVKSVCKPDPDNAKSWLEFYVLYMGLAPLSAFPKSSRFRVTAQGDGVRLRRHTGYETTGQPVPEPTGDTLGKGAGVLILRRESFVLQGKEEPFGLARPLKDGKPHGASCWVSLRDGYLEEDGNAYDNLPDWMWQAVAQGIFDVVVNPGEPLHIAAGDAVGFLAEDIAPAGKCELAPSYFAHIEVLSVDPRMPDFLSNPGNVDAGTHYIRLGLHKPLYLRTGETFEAMSAITERDGGKLLERDKCHPAESGGKTYYQIRPHTWMCGDDVDEVRQFDLAERGFSALTENTVSDMKDSLKAGWMRDALMWFAERMNPEKGMRQGMMSRYYKGMVDKLDTDHDGMLSARELFAAVHHPEMGIRKLASRLVVKHDPEWFGGSAHHKWATFFQNYDVLRVDYAKKWLDDCEWMSQVPAFSPGAGVWHMHPVVFLDAIQNVEVISLEEARVRAFMRMLRVGEGTIGDKGYETLFGGQSFINDYQKDFSDHPKISITRGELTSSAAGAYQVMGYSWDDRQMVSARKKYNIHDFTPLSQDRFCVIIIKIKRKGSLEKIMSGDISGALDLLSYEWASLPPGRYGQPTKTREEAMRLYDGYLKDELDGSTDLYLPVGYIMNLLRS